MSISFDSFSTLSELDIASVVLANSAERADSASRAPSDGKMAPTQTIETVTIVRPLKVTAFICGLIVLLLMALALASSDWLISDGWRQGLFAHCTEEAAALRPALRARLSPRQGCRVYHLVEGANHLLYAAGRLRHAVAGLGLWSKDTSMKTQRDAATRGDEFRVDPRWFTDDGVLLSAAGYRQIAAKFPWWLHCH